MSRLLLPRTPLPAVSEFFRIGLFVVFYVFSLRVLFIFLCSATQKDLRTLVPLLLAIAALSWLRPTWVLCGLAAFTPFISGLELWGLGNPFSFLSLGFATVFLFWFPRQILQRKEFRPHTWVGRFVDLLSVIVFLSLLFTLSPHPFDLVSAHFWNHLAGSPNDLFYGIDAAFVLLQGLFFYRLFELTSPLGSAPWAIRGIFSIHIGTIIFFSVIQLISRRPELYAGFAVYAPFADIHSYGSYLSFLWAFLLGSRVAGDRRNSYLIFLAILLILAAISFSRITWLAVGMTGFLFILWNLSPRKRILAITALVLLLLVINFHTPKFLSSNNDEYVRRLRRLLVIKELPEQLRGVVWNRAKNLISAYPLTGSGIGTFFAVSPAYQDRHVKEFIGYQENAHNYFFQLAAELGIPALLVFLALLFFTYRSGLEAISLLKESRSVRLGILWGLSTYLLTCLTGHPLLLVNQQFLFWFAISALVLFPQRKYWVNEI